MFYLAKGKDGQRDFDNYFEALQFIKERRHLWPITLFERETPIRFFKPIICGKCKKNEHQECWHHRCDCQSDKHIVPMKEDENG